MSGEDNLIGRFLSAEMALTTIVMLGGLYGTFTVLADDQQEQSVEIGKIKSHQAEIKTSVQKIETAVAIIQNDQQHLNRDIQDIKQMLEKRQERESQR